jgi:esterase
MQLFYRQLGTGQPLIILHGLYGSSDNWYSIARALSSEWEVFMPDQRNHGNSPHSDDLNYPLLAADLLEFMTQHSMEKARIIGHSMGGKAALSFGLSWPAKVEKMVIVDISPFAYDETSAAEVTDHLHILKSLAALHPETLSTRQEADERLKGYISSETVRQFLLKNLKRDPNGKFYWTMNLQAMQDHLAEIYDSVIPENMSPEQVPSFPLLFVKGERSQYIPQRDIPRIMEYFPHAQITAIPGAGHWVHAEKPAEFLEVVARFLR